MERAIQRQPLCILCDQGVADTNEIPATEEGHPDRLCWGCIVLSPAARKPIRGESTARLMSRHAN